MAVREANQFRHKMFEGRKKLGSELTERDRALVRKREELALVCRRLRDADLSQAVTRELRKHQALLEQQIAELER